MTDIRLQDRYEARSGTVLINGVRALVRLMLLQAEIDKGERHRKRAVSSPAIAGRRLAVSIWHSEKLRASPPTAISWSSLP